MLKPKFKLFNLIFTKKKKERKTNPNISILPWCREVSMCQKRDTKSNNILSVRKHSHLAFFSNSVNAVLCRQISGHKISISLSNSDFPQ